MRVWRLETVIFPTNGPWYSHERYQRSNIHWRSLRSIVVWSLALDRDEPRAEFERKLRTFNQPIGGIEAGGSAAATFLFFGFTNNNTNIPTTNRSKTNKIFLFVLFL